MIKNAVLGAIGALLVAGAITAAFVLGGSGEDSEPPQTTQSTAVPTQPASVSSPTPRPAATVTPRPNTTAPTDRSSCAEIKGTPYRSDTERAFYLANCAATTQSTGASPPNTSVDTSPSCSTDIQIKTSRTDGTFDVSGTTLDQIDASLQANGPVVEGETAAGLTEYEYGIDGSFCTRAGSCSIGAMSVTASIVVTLPNLTTLSQVTPDIKALWDRFAELVRVHENRHVTIVEEGMAEIKRQLLLVAEQPNCDSLDHEIDKVWLLYSSQMEQRQNAFHAADRSGQGGSVVR